MGKFSPKFPGDFTMDWVDLSIFSHPRRKEMLIFPGFLKVGSKNCKKRA
jgi:hypothetical protein